MERGPKGRPGSLNKDSFVQALVDIAEKKGIHGPTALAKTVVVSPGVVSHWYHGVTTPSPEHMGKLLSNLELDEQEHQPQIEAVVSTWSIYLQERAERLQIALKNRVRTERQPKPGMYTPEAAAEMLGVTRQTIWNHKQKHGIGNTDLTEEEVEAIREDLANSPMKGWFKATVQEEMSRLDLEK